MSERITRTTTTTRRSGRSNSISRRARTRRRSTSSNHHKPTNPRFLTPTLHHRSKPPRPTKLVLLQRCKSEPILYSIDLLFNNHDKNQYPEEQPCNILYRPQTCTDIFVSPFSPDSPSPSIFERYKEDAKVVVNVTVEGSPGPIRTLVRLGASVEETIETVVKKYGKEGRRPYLDHDEISGFELHYSHFSLESISKKDKIGDVGSRSFFLRRNDSNKSSNSSSITTKEDNKPQAFSAEESRVVLVLSPLLLLSAFFARKFKKIGRRTKKLWKVMGCLTCG